MKDVLIAAFVIGIFGLIIFCCILKRRIDELKDIVGKNKQFIDSEISNVNKKISRCNSRLDNAAKTIKQDQQVLTAHELQISNIKKEIEEIKDPIKDFIASKKLMVEDNNTTDDINNAVEAAKKLDDEQLSAFNKMNIGNSNLFITGKAGTGKSYLLRNFVKNTKKKVLVIAPTGVAALNINGVTIHSAFGWRFLNKLSIDEITADTLLSLKSEKRHILKNVHTIIIDEISMVRADTFEKIDKILKILNASGLPFGGKQMIVFGDLFQLPPIANNKEEEDYLKNTFGGIYFFNSNAYKEGNFDFIELSTNHRQKKDKRFFKILNNIREGVVTEDNLLTLNKRIVTDKESLDKTIIRLFPKKEKANIVNNSELDKIDEKEYRFNWSVECLKPLTEEQKRKALKDIPALETLKIKNGAVVMMINNDVNGRWVNGTLGIVGDILDKFIKVIINGKVYKVGLFSFEYNEPVYKDGEIKYEPIINVVQFPIIPAYAITIHKSQGMTYQQIAVDVSNSFAPGQVYVALSRCATLDGLHLLSPVTKDNLAVDPDILTFYKRLISKKKE